jgi:AcrR family transcriptional regulator
MDFRPNYPNFVTWSKNMTASRANTLEDKQLKHQTIIDAAAHLFQHDLTLPTVATIAKTSGQAKGTVYLYFSSKETIYLSLLKQHYAIWFSQLNQTLTITHSLAELLNCFVKYPLEDALFFPLASLSCSTLEPGCNDTVRHDYYQWMNDNFSQLSAQISQQFPMLNDAQALAFFNDSHAQILGLWQQKQRHLDADFGASAKTALARLWKGYFAK